MWSYFEAASDAASSAYDAAADAVADTADAISDYFWPEEEDTEPGYLDWEYWFPGTDPAEDGGDQPSSNPISECPYDEESDKKKSLYIDIEWMFSGGTPTGTYTLTVAGQTFSGDLSNATIRIDEELDSLCGDGELIVSITNGPTYRADIHLDLPNVQDVVGMKRRLTNMGYYAGTDDGVDNRFTWALRAFKRKAINGYTRNRTEQEHNEVTDAMLTALMNQYGNGQPHVGDAPNTSMEFGFINPNNEDTKMFGVGLVQRGSFEDAAVPDDRDPEGAGTNGIWTGQPAAGVIEITGIYDLYLRAFDPHAGDPPMHNHVALPQHIHMIQFVLFELGFWLVAGDNRNGERTLNEYTPDGGYGRFTQWAVREFQCYAKSDTVAMEDENDISDLYIKRLLAWGVMPINGDAQYPNDGRISGSTNEATRIAMQRWADNLYRCPVVCYSSSDTATGANMDRVQHDNVWSYNDFQTGRPRCFALNFSSFYDVPAEYRQNASWNGFNFLEPIVLGFYTTGDAARDPGGGVGFPWSGHSWASEHVEVRPDTLVNPADPGDGSALTEAQLSTFKVIRTASHFECLGYLDTLNTYDRVTISFGTCHWTLAWCHVGGTATEAREMPAMLAYYRSENSDSYFSYYGRFGLFPLQTWPLPMTADRKYEAQIGIQTETGTVVLSGATGQRAENNYCKTWHSYFRFQMACRVSRPKREAMWDFARFRVRDILNFTFDIGGVERRIGDYATSEKAVAMIHRWHIYLPAHMIGNRMRNAINSIITANPPLVTEQAREDAFIAQLVTQSGVGTTYDMAAHIPLINGWADIPQSTTINGRAYSLALANPTLSSDEGSFDFAEP